MGCLSCLKMWFLSTAGYHLPPGKTWKHIWKAPRIYCISYCVDDAQEDNWWNTSTTAFLISITYVVVRFLLASIWLGIVVWSWNVWITSHIPFHKWWAYLSHQGAFLELVQLWFGATTTLLAMFPDTCIANGESVPWFVKVTWLLGDAVPVVAFMIFAMFWAPEWFAGGNNLVKDGLAYALHGANVVFVIIDSLLSRRPRYIAHIYVPLCYTLFYVVFTWFYYLAGGTDANGNPYIYIFLDWSHTTNVRLWNLGPKRLLSLLGMVGVPIIYVVFQLLLNCFFLLKEDTPSDVTYAESPDNSREVQLITNEQRSSQETPSA